MEYTTTAWFAGHCAAATPQVHVLVPAFKPRSTGGVRLVVDGGLITAPSGPPLTD